MENKLAVNALTPASGVTPSPAAPAPTSGGVQMQNDAADLRHAFRRMHHAGRFVRPLPAKRLGG